MDIHIVETRLAWVERTTPDRVVVRVKEETKLDTCGIAEVLGARHHLGGQHPHTSLVLMPPELDFDLAMMNNDHYKDHPVRGATMGVAIVAEEGMMNRIASLYFSYFPAPFPTRVFATEREAACWLGTLRMPLQVGRAS